jgi:hypothetical protein
MSDELNNQADPNQASEPVEDDFPMPPATFEWFVISLSMQAEMYLGRLRTGDDKTKGNLTVEEQRLIENTLTELRFRYVAAVEEKRKAQTA